MPWRIERANILRYGIEAFPDSQALVGEFFNDRLIAIREYESVRPEQAAAQFRETIGQLNDVLSRLDNKAAILTLRIKIEKADQKFRRRFQKNKLPGSPAPELDQIKWLNQLSDNSTDHEIPTILYFFDWGAEHATDSLVQIQRQLDQSKAVSANLIAVVPDFGLDFDWLDTFDRKDKLQPKPKEAFAANIQKNLEHKFNFQFPFGISTQPVQLADKFGITDTPFAVIISKSGVVTDVFSGKTVAADISDCLQNK